MGRQDGHAHGARDRRPEGDGSVPVAADQAEPRAGQPASAGDAHGAGRRPLLIVNADDFGASQSVNAAVLEAHRHGVLSSASLMVTGAAFDEAVSLAREAPRLAVGLHLVLVHGRAAAPPETIPHLADAAGRLPDDPAAFGLRLAFDARLQREVATEIRAQLRRFASTGLPLAHVDGHLNFHMHPAVFPVLARDAVTHGAHGMRLPRDDLALALRHDRRRVAQKLFLALAFGLLGAWARTRLPPGLHATDRVYGLFMSGHVTAAYALDAVARLRSGSAELYAHPATAAGEPLGPNPTDLATLCDPALVAALGSGRVRLGSYATLGPL
ncbi:MAG: hopanoid biosynthesis-associated protein HpnK [Deinococcales bacterium]